MQKLLNESGKSQICNAHDALRFHIITINALFVRLLRLKMYQKQITRLHKYSFQNLLVLLLKNEKKNYYNGDTIKFKIP